LAVITIPFIKQIYKKIGTSGIIGQTNPSPSDSN
jgi:hypothetical protein